MPRLTLLARLDVAGTGCAHMGTLFERLLHYRYYYYYYYYYYYFYYYYHYLLIPLLLLLLLLLLLAGLKAEGLMKYTLADFALACSTIVVLKK